VDPFVLMLALMVGLAVGLLGAVAPAIRCLRLPIPTALKAIRHSLTLLLRIYRERTPETKVHTHHYRPDDGRCRKRCCAGQPFEVTSAGASARRCHRSG